MPTRSSSARTTRTQGGTTARGLLSGALRWQRPGRALQLQGYLGRRELRIRDNFTGFLLDERGDGLEQRYDATPSACAARYALEPHALGQRSASSSASKPATTSRARACGGCGAKGAIPYATVFDSELGLTHGGCYARAELARLPWLAFIARRARRRVRVLERSTSPRPRAIAAASGCR